ncbi:hypothetical protein PRUPE_1G431800 [Prunus persica]|uniref:Uncharacterized protein n=1 Tax=Prunus persica TaxID=3760 RepID=M5XKX2_PRUPE|nr:uncharacterized protein LOC18790059 [Prunus persica]ONI33552.1 hypothetical protein PRUPE_1G431800 [Prunus persica]
MFGLVHGVVVLVCIPIVAVIVGLVLWRWNCYRKNRQSVGGRTENTRPEGLQAGIAKLHHHQPAGLESKRPTGNNYYRRGVSGKPLFSWANHPTSITDAVENGWSRFAFTSFMSSPSTKSRLLGLCAVGDQRIRETEPEISWEVCQGSADFMQKIRLNSGLKKVLNLGSSNSTAAASVIRTALPLPGPALGNNSFPQETYFEITILYSRGDELSESNGKVKEGEKTKLIQETKEENPGSDSLVHVTSSQRISRIEELKLSVKEDHHNHGKGEAILLSVGLTVGGSLPLKLPGSYPGSIGFGSNGSVHLDGIKLVFESEKATWGRIDKVIGCGFDPRQKKVYFTVESELVHVIHCKSEEFSTPLYPTLAANTDMTVLVNLGQSVFKYAPANAQRTPNPCFVGPLVRSSAAAFYEDSMELFSMERIDSQWLNRCTTKGSQNPSAANHELEFDEESEADLFEIVLESCGRSPHVVS